MVAAKSFVAAALLSLLLAAAALAANPKVRITPADQRRAVEALLRESDFGAGWQGGQTSTSPLDAPSCPGFSPSAAGLLVSGHADARFTDALGGVVVDQDVEVLGSAAQVRTDFARTITPKLAPCLGYQLDHSANVVAARVARVDVHLPESGVSVAAYDAVVTVHSATEKGPVLSDYLFLGVGRTEYSFNILAPTMAQPELLGFEYALAHTVLARADAVGG